MEVLIRKTGKKIVGEYSAPPRRLAIGDDVIFPGAERPLDLGAHILVVATDDDVDPATQKKGAAQITGTGKNIAAHYPAVTLTLAETTARVRAERRAAYPDRGDQLDAILKWANMLRMQQPEIAGATTIAGLKAALAPLGDLPQDLDNIIGQWLAVKAANPLPE